MGRFIRKPIRAKLTDTQEAILRSHKTVLKMVSVTAPDGTVVEECVPVKVYPMFKDFPVLVKDVVHRMPAGYGN